MLNGSQVWTAGQVIGLIHDVPTCAELCTRIEREAEETISKAAALIAPKASHVMAASSKL
jgi:NAD(P)H-dependent flavin oxidoreductase YrpB (nitropropane dioxygenase family)